MIFQLSRPFLAVRRAIASLIALAFLLNTILPANAQNILSLPTPGIRIGLSPDFTPALLNAVKVDPQNPFRFDFIVDVGDADLRDQALKDESNKLIKYFLASLTTPEDDL